MRLKSTRREFFQGVLGTGLAYTMNPFLAKGLAEETNPTPPAPKVVLARNERFFGSGGQINNVLVGKAVDDGIMRLTGQGSPAKAWASLFDPKDVVGLKLNCLAKKAFSPHLELVESIIKGLVSAGVKEGNIIVFDRYTRELEEAGFRLRKSGGVQCLGTDELAGGGYEPRPQVVGSVGSCFSRIVSSFCSALISVPVLKDHDLSGVSVAMKNFYGVIHNPNKYHDNNCDPYIAELNTHPYIKNKLRLVICDALVAQYNGGPAFKSQWAWPFGGILMGMDPVAVDRISANIIEEKRKEMGLPSLKQVKREPKYIQTAARLGLGIDATEKIKLIVT
ncbi:MAG TPA: DUF362 domain-containing protein [Candidatus Hypogeohydataceae bacterium YC38]